MIRALLLASTLIAAAGSGAIGQTAAPASQSQVELRPSDVLKSPVLQIGRAHV